jgi:hypothetical protein
VTELPKLELTPDVKPVAGPLAPATGPKALLPVLE